MIMAWIPDVSVPLLPVWKANVPLSSVPNGGVVILAPVPAAGCVTAAGELLLSSSKQGEAYSCKAPSVPLVIVAKVGCRGRTAAGLEQVLMALPRLSCTVSLPVNGVPSGYLKVPEIVTSPFTCPNRLEAKSRATSVLKCYSSNRP